MKKIIGGYFLAPLLSLITFSKADFETQSFQNEFQNKINLFVDVLLSSLLDKCSVIHYRNIKTEEQSGPQASIGTLPVIELNSEFVQRDSTFFDNFDKNHLSRHGKQCKIYVIHQGQNQNKISSIFVNPSLQVQAHQSYVIFLGESRILAEQTLLSSNLNNYKHRIWLQPSDITSYNPNLRFQMKHHYYCYTCKEKSSPGLVVTNSFPNSLSELFPDVTGNLNGHSLVCTAPQAPPLVAIIDSSPNNQDDMEIVGMQAIILKDMANKMNFTFTLKRASNGATGIPLPNGTWTGIMGEILTKQADIGLSVAVSYERNQILEFTVPVFHAFLVLVSVKPLPHFAWEAIFYPFNTSAWFAIMTSTVVTILSYKFLANKSKFKCRQISFLKSAYLAVGALLEQGVPLTLITNPSRVLAGFWFLFAIVVTCAYRSKLFMFLTFPTIEKQPGTLKDLSVSDYSWGMKSLGGVGLLLITKSPLTYSRHVGERLELSFDKYSCLDKTFTHHFVCIIYRAYIDYVALVRYWKISHKLHVSDYVTSSVGSSWVLPKFSTMLPLLDQYHLRQFEMGLANRYVENYQQSAAMEARAQAEVSNSTEDNFDINTNYVREEDGPKALKLENLGGAFFILLFGSLIAVGIFLTEIFRNYGKKNDVNRFATRKQPNKLSSIEVSIARVRTRRKLTR